MTDNEYAKREYKSGYNAALTASKRVCLDALRKYQQEADKENNGNFSRGLRDGLYFVYGRIESAVYKLQADKMEEKLC